MLTLAAGMVACMIISVLVSVHVIEQGKARERRALALAEQREQQARATARAATCSFITTINNAYKRQADELSEPGKEIAQAWATLAGVFGCT